MALEAGRPDVAAPIVDDFPGVFGVLKEKEEPTLRFGYAFLLYHQKQYLEAARLFGWLLPVPDWCVWAHNMLGLCRYQMGQLDSSLQHFCEALRRVTLDTRHDYRQLYFNQACALYRQGKLRDTLGSLQALWRLDPDYPQVAEWIDEVKASLNGGDSEPRCGGALKPQPKPPNLLGSRKIAGFE